MWTKLPPIARVPQDPPDLLHVVAEVGEQRCAHIVGDRQQHVGQDDGDAHREHRARQSQQDHPQHAGGVAPQRPLDDPGQQEHDEQRHRQEHHPLVRGIGAVEPRAGELRLGRRPEEVQDRERQVDHGTLSRDPTTAAAIAHDEAIERLDVGSPSCRTLGWDLDITDQNATVTLTCTVDLSEAALVPVPGSVQVSATSTEIFDRFAEG